MLWSDVFVPVYILALDAGTPNWDSINLGMKVMKAVTMAHSAVYDKLTKKKVTLLRIRTAALGKSGERNRDKNRLIFISSMSIIIRNLQSHAELNPNKNII